MDKIIIDYYVWKSKTNGGGIMSTAYAPASVAVSTLDVNPRL